VKVFEEIDVREARHEHLYTLNDSLKSTFDSYETKWSSKDNFKRHTSYQFDASMDKVIDLFKLYIALCYHLLFFEI